MCASKKYLIFLEKWFIMGYTRLDLTNGMCCKTHRKKSAKGVSWGKKIGSCSFGGMRKPSAEYIEMPVCEGLTHTFFEKRRFFVEKSFRWGNLNTAVKKG